MSPALGAEARNHWAQQVDKADSWSVGLEGSEQLKRKCVFCFCGFCSQEWHDQHSP